MRIAVLLKDRCQPKNCTIECIKYCPKVRSGDETILIDDRGKPVISEDLCVGCGICVHKCPFDAIKIIGLAEELEKDLIHQFGQNGFRLFRLPYPKKGQVIGLLGPNGIGKTTAISILSGQIVPNLGKYESEPTWDRVLERYAGTELFDYLKKLSVGRIRASVKPQYVDKLPKLYKGKVGKLLSKIDENKMLDKVVDDLGIKPALNRDINKLSGGELQRVAIAATMLKDAEIYFFDEPSSYLDIYQRLKIAKIIRRLAEEKGVIVVEHDLAVLDFIADTVYLMYGSEGAYGVIAQPRGVRNAINTYLSGYLREENIRFREWAITFESHPPRKEWKSEVLVKFNALTKRFKGFVLETKSGEIHKGEVVGVVGPNSTGKTTFVKMLADEINPTKGEIELDVNISYKPQYIKINFDGTVSELYSLKLGETIESGFFRAEIEHPLELKKLYNKKVEELSGGELQRVAIAVCLAHDTDIYLLDEPSAYLDSNQRMVVAKVIRRVIEKRGKSAMVVDHDIYFIDLVSDSIMNFSGQEAVHGYGEGPFEMREGMNRFLREVGITFRRDAETNRPRINKLNSRLDREQKEMGEYYYTEV